MDSTCNGYQHFSLLLGEDFLATQVNIINRSKQNYPEDFYTFIAIKFADSLKDCLNEEKYKRTHKDLTITQLKKELNLKLIKKDLYNKFKELDEL